jgi:hypothetical protein
MRKIRSSWFDFHRRVRASQSFLDFATGRVGGLLVAERLEDGFMDTLFITPLDQTVLTDLAPTANGNQAASHCAATAVHTAGNVGRF